MFHMIILLIARFHIERVLELREMSKNARHYSEYTTNQDKCA